MKKWIKRCKKKNQKKLNNQGFTLVELILAMIVLAVVVSPFLHAFLTSTRINIRARQKSQATTLAQSVMEGLRTEAYTTNEAGEYTDVTLPHLENVMYQFTYPTLNNNLDNFYILPKATLGEATMGEIFSGNPSIKSSDGGQTYTFNENADMKYYMYFLNVKQQGSYYDILVTLDGSDYGETAFSGQNFNATDLVQIPSIDTKYDAVSTKNFDGEAYSEFQNKASLYGTTFSLSNVERNMIINLVTDGVGKLKVTAKYEYIYHVSGVTSYEYNGPEITIYNGAADDFRNVYFYYFPNYGSTNTNVMDHIIVKNNIESDPSAGNAPYDFELFLIKQRDESLNDTELRMNESAYRCYVNIQDSNSSNSGNSPVAIRTNLGKNLYGALDTASGIDYQINNQAIYYHNVYQIPGSALKSYFSLNEVTNKNKKTAYLTATIRVYEHSMTGTPSLSDFTSKTPLVTIDGSFVN